ncbi:LacI family DNA-binding transcriptional regulator [Pleomorphomonas sp. T1.2MG-36]|uniref:LacI family DNA-binding transcriptional regulator n=1 Tax=Pleomorphomonas sp. T1.2MG-36 TaxID=3041167 RepID=UPI00254268FA|nr:LacI family DNA-binding transcriptional regulator [Pleomorphomonas sp. T1.2MG-36]
MKPRTTIRDVARKAGVSVGTVSRVVNGHPSVTEAKKRIVDEVIAELGFQPDAAAQGLRRGTNRTLGVVIPDLRNPFFADLMQHIELRAKERGYSVLFASSDEQVDSEADLIASLARSKVEGVVVVPSNRASSLANPEGVRLVVVDRRIAGHPFVAADHRAGARMAAEYLVSLGHRRIACISGPENAFVARERLAGFMDVMAPRLADAGLDPAAWIVSAPFNYEGGREAAKVLLADDGPKPTAVFACSDQQAIGVLRVAFDRHIAIPGELSVVGFDGILVSDLVVPRVTTAVQPVASIARCATDLLIGGEALDASASHIFPCAMALRETCAPPR